MPVVTAPAPAPQSVARPNSAPAKAIVPRVSVAEYLTAERRATLRHEYIRGVVREMSGGTYEHSLISANITVALATALDELDYSVLNSDLKVYVERGVLYYPDGCVVEGDPQIDFDEAVRNPVIVVEVLSSSTESFDRGEKFENYRAIPSLGHYLLVNQERPFIEHFAKGADGLWTLVGEPKGLDAELVFSNPDVRIPLSKVYRRVTFATSETMDGEEAEG